MPELSEIARILPPPIRDPIRSIWRKFRGNPELNFLRLLSVPDRLALDVGANSGDYAAFLVRHNRGCMAFEPNPRMVRAIEAKHGHLGFRTENCAISDREEEVEFRIPVIDGEECFELGTIEAQNKVASLSVRSYKVPCRRLDDFGLGPVGVVKIDVEGHELAVLRGAESLIERDRPNLFIEAEDRHRPGAVASIREFLEHRGYRGFMLWRRRVRPIEEFDPAFHQNPSAILGIVVVEVQNYVNNFAFVHDAALADRIAKMARRGRSL